MSFVKDITDLIASQDIQRNSDLRDSLFASKVYVWGAGNAGALTLGLLKQMNIDIEGFIDRRASAMGTYMNKPVFSVNDSEIDIETTENCFIIIAFLCSYQQLNDLRQWLAMRNHKDSCYYHDIYTLLITNEFIENKINTNYKEQIVKVADTLSDEISRRVFQCFINAVMHANCDLFAEPVDNQYFINDVSFAKGYSHFVDCGAFNGDTAVALKKNKGLVQKLALFEPDNANFKALCDNLRINRVAAEAILFPCGVWSQTKMLSFKSGNQDTSGISEDGDIFVQCVAMDDVIRDFQPTFIKMDIEGAEYEALLGAEEVIKQYKPDLAISVYHRIQDMWEIPLLIKKFNPDYRLYLRCHGVHGVETILYATSVE